MIGWDDEPKKRYHLLFFLAILLVLAGYLTGWYVATHRCPQEDSCGYSNHQWQPVEH